MIEQMKASTSHKEVQTPNGRLAALSRFLLKADELYYTFFHILRANKMFEYTTEFAKFFQAIKQHLHAFLTLAKPSPNEPLFKCICISPLVFYAILDVIKNNSWLSVYYVSKMLAATETMYREINKCLCDLIVVTRNLQPYFNTLTITVLTNQSPLNTT